MAAPHGGVDVPADQVNIRGLDTEQHRRWQVTAALSGAGSLAAWVRRLADAEAARVLDLGEESLVRAGAAVSGAIRGSGGAGPADGRGDSQQLRARGAAGRPRPSEGEVAVRPAGTGGARGGPGGADGVGPAAPVRRPAAPKAAAKPGRSPGRRKPIPDKGGSP